MERRRQRQESLRGGVPWSGELPLGPRQERNMALIDIWNNSPEEIHDKQINQLIAIAGDGTLRDSNSASSEFRTFLDCVSYAHLARYAKECLEQGFDGSGFALQDVVNQIGSRLGFKVKSGLYRGKVGAAGHDGLWKSPEGQSLIVEVKTTDTYRVALDKIAGYQKQLAGADEIDLEESSILIVVGRQDTGDLEAQIRGSRYAWDIRLISVEYLLKMLDLKEDVEDPQIAVRIRAILKPQEFTRVDGIVDLLFSAKEDIQEETQSANSDDDESVRTEKSFTPVSFHEACIQRISEKLRLTLVKRSRATFSTNDEKVAVVCAVSREHEMSAGKRYWFAFHPYQQETLLNAKMGHVAFGCGSANTLVLIPYRDFAPWISEMNQTRRDDGKTYWHVHINDEGGNLTLHKKAGTSRRELNKYLA